jgi:hypothetical protein
MLEPDCADPPPFQAAPHRNLRDSAHAAKSAVKCRAAEGTRAGATELMDGPVKTSHCTCGNRLFFDNTQCVRCGSETGLCPECYFITALEPTGEGVYRCGHADCATHLVKCRNYAVEQVCNGLVEVAADGSHDWVLCHECLLTRIIPNLSVPGNREKWRLLEAAKRRVLYTVHALGLPVGRPDNTVEPKLVFHFKADEDEPVYTGHANGVITININEADDVEREKTRVAFGEPQRTLVGHFRHELGHYYWDMLVQGHCEGAFRDLFGDERNPSYADAQARYYQEGPRPHWQGQFISAYATMHPWEDFAETFGTYLDMVAILDTASSLPGEQLRNIDCLKMLAAYQQVGILVNELNREMGIQDLVPEVFTGAVVDKLTFVHRLIAKCTTP